MGSMTGLEMREIVQCGLWELIDGLPSPTATGHCSSLDLSSPKGPGSVWAHNS